MKERLFPYLSPLAAALPFSLLWNWAGKPLLLPFYHAVSKEPLPYLEELYRYRGPTAFEQELLYLKRLARPIDFAELTALGGQTPPEPLFHLSFDDGLASCYETVLPLLRKHGIEATFFLNPAFVDNQASFYRHREALASPGADQALRLDYRPYLSRQQLGDLLDEGHTLGAHSWDHPRFGTLSAEQQIEQIARSVEWVRQFSGQGLVPFAFPFSDQGTAPETWAYLKKMEIPSFGTAGLGMSGLHHQRIDQEKYPPENKSRYRYELLWHGLKRRLTRFNRD